MVKYYAIIQVATEKIISIECDKCHRVFQPNNFRDTLEIAEFVHINFTGGFESIFGDGVKVECDLCQECAKDLIGKFCHVTFPEGTFVD